MPATQPDFPWRVGSLLLCALALCPALVRGEGPEDNVRGKISRNFYRIPYENTTQVEITRDYVDHGVSQGGSSSDAGRMDMHRTNGVGTLVAPADGEVIAVFDGNDDCGCDAAYGGCANAIAIRHANGEVSKYLHIAQNSALVTVGQFVVQGQDIATEGDVGYTCGGGSAARAGTCLPAVPNGAGSCGRHLHWEVYREADGEFVNPMICSVAGSIFQDDGTYTANSCANNCADDAQLSSATYSGFGTFEVVQANASITADATVIDDLAAVVLHAGNRITLGPGVSVVAEAYFRAEIGPCNDTAPSP